MIIKNIVQIGNQKAREKSIEVKDAKAPEVQKIVQDLLDTMEPAQLIGMAAPQIGHGLRVFVTQMRTAGTRPDSKDDEPRVFVNPKIISVSEAKQTGYEGCGSVGYGKIFGPVERSKKVTVEAINQKGEPFTLKAHGLLARIIQHEYDHLEGIFFTDRVEDNTQLMSLDEYVKARKEKRI
jgi:peptide deformylase